MVLALKYFVFYNAEWAEYSIEITPADIWCDVLFTKMWQVELCKDALLLLNITQLLRIHMLFSITGFVLPQF